MVATRVKSLELAIRLGFSFVTTQGSAPPRHEDVPAPKTSPFQNFPGAASGILPRLDASSARLLYSKESVLKFIVIACPGRWGGDQAGRYLALARNVSRNGIRSIAWETCCRSYGGSSRTFATVVLMDSRSGKALLRSLIGCSGVLGILVCWYLATDVFEIIRPIQFPSPEDAYASLLRLVRGYAGGTLLEHILASTKLVVIGFALAALTGVPLGLLMGCSKAADSYLNPIFQIIRPIAPIAWIPLTILWFGLGATAKLFVIWLAAFAPTLINTSTGAKNVNSTLIAAARVHGATPRRLLTDVVIPGALPSIFTGLRVSLQACWMVLVAAELVGSFAGLGHVMIIATRDLDPGMILVAMACVAALGILFSLMLTYVERIVTPWRR